MEQNFVDIAILIAYGLLGLAALAAIIMPLINSIGNPKSLLKGLIGVVLILILFGIAYVISGSEVTATYMKFGVDTGMSKFVGASLITMYLLVVISLVGIFFTEIAKIFR
jgi:hypothetical protein